MNFSTRLDRLISDLQSGRLKTKAAPFKGRLVDILRKPAWPADIVKETQTPGQGIGLLNRLFQSNQKGNRQ